MDRLFVGPGACPQAPPADADAPAAGADAPEAATAKEAEAPGIRMKMQGAFTWRIPVFWGV